MQMPVVLDLYVYRHGKNRELWPQLVIIREGGGYSSHRRLLDARLRGYDALVAEGTAVRERPEGLSLVPEMPDAGEDHGDAVDRKSVV